MAFRVGQKVVCVVAKIGDTAPGGIEPDLGDIGTVVATGWAEEFGQQWIDLMEWPAPENLALGFGRGWLAESFRPVVERKTDISIFTAMLNPSRETVSG